MRICAFFKKANAFKYTRKLTEEMEKKVPETAQKQTETAKRKLPPGAAVFQKIWI